MTHSQGSTGIFSLQSNEASRLAGGTLALAVAPSPASAVAPDDAVGLRIEGPAGPVAAGQLFTVKIFVEAAADLGAFEFTYAFDDGVVFAAAADIRLAELLGSTGRTTGELYRELNTPGRVAFGAYTFGSAAGTSGSGLLVTIAMRAKASGASSLTLEDLIVTDTRGEIIDATVQAGSVQVGGDAPAPSLFLPLLLRNP